MESINLSDQRIETYFKGYDTSNYYYFNHLSGVLVIVVDNGCEKGIFVRCDSQCSNIVRQYHKEVFNGVPKEYRIYDDLTKQQFNTILEKVESTISVNF